VKLRPDQSGGFPAQKYQVALAIEASGEANNYSFSLLLAGPGLHRFKCRIIRIASRIVTSHVVSTSSSAFLAVGYIAVTAGQTLAIIRQDCTIRAGDDLDLKRLVIAARAVIKHCRHNSIIALPFLAGKFKGTRR
jgi:hypothetical protein